MRLPYFLLLLPTLALSAPTSTSTSPTTTPTPTPDLAQAPLFTRPEVWKPTDSVLMPDGSIIHSDGRIQVHGNFYIQLIQPYYSDYENSVDLCELWEPYHRHPTDRWHDHCEGGELVFHFGFWWWFLLLLLVCDVLC
jgi:hypothetical protein